MTDATDYLESQTLDRFFANVSPDGAIDGPTVALWTTGPADAPDATNEVSGDSYSRFTTTSADWSTFSTGDSGYGYENSTALDFGVLDSSTSTSVEGVVLIDDTGTSDKFLYASGDVSKSVAAGDEFKINAGDASFTMD